MIRNLFKLLFYPFLGNMRTKPKAPPTKPLNSVFGADRMAAIQPMLHFTGGRRPIGEANTLLLLSDRSYDPAALTGDRVTFVGTCAVS